MEKKEKCVSTLNEGNAFSAAVGTLQYPVQGKVRKHRDRNGRKESEKQKTDSAKGGKVHWIRKFESAY